MSAGILGRAIKSVLHRLVRKVEAMMQVPNPHLHFIIDTSLRATVDVLLFLRLAKHRQVLPADASGVARVLAAQTVDCGSCVQFTVNMSLAEGARPEWIRAAVEHRPEALPPELQEIYAFTGHILQHTYGGDALREAIRARYGDRGLVDLAFAIATATVIPVTNQALGFATSCSKVVVKVADAKQTTTTAIESRAAA